MKNLSLRQIIYNSPEYEAALDVRHEVLRKPLGLSFNLEELSEEENHLHCAAFYGPELIATASLVPDRLTCKMRQVAIKTMYQKQGIGSKLLDFIEQRAKSEGFKIIYCHARDQAVSFYKKNSYVPEGDYFYEVGIAHLKMLKILK